MKKILSIIAAGALAVLAVSCAKDEKVTFDNTKDATAPVLGTFTVGSNVVVNYTPAVFSKEFNQKMPVFHTLGLVSVNEEACDVTLSSAKDNGASVSISDKNLTNALLLRGFDYGDKVNLELVVRASIQDPSKGVTNGYIDSEGKAAFEWTLAKPSQGGDPYAGWETSTWGVTGSIASAGLNWDKDIEMVTDGTWHVAKGVVLTASDEFKFRKDGGWDVNFGGDFAMLDEEFSVTQGGPNIKVTEDGTYDLFLNPDAGIAKVIVTGSNVVADPYAEFTEPSTWSVIGSIASTGNSWNADSPMVTNGTWHVCRNLELTATDEFKFRKDAGWDVNFGGDLVALGEEFAVTQGGPNIKVLEDGTYDLLLNPDAAVVKVIPAGEDPKL